MVGTIQYGPEPNTIHIRGIYTIDFFMDWSGMTIVVHGELHAHGHIRCFQMINGVTVYPNGRIQCGYICHANYGGGGLPD